MGPALALFLAVPLAAFDYQDPSFWNQQYGFPDSSCRHTLIIEPSSIKKAQKDLAACSKLDWLSPGRWQARCRLPLEQAESIVSALKSRHRILSYEHQCSDHSWSPDLDYKLRSLEDEMKSLQLPAESFPSLLGLLDSQIAAIKRLLLIRSRARLAALAVIVAEKGAAPSDVRPQHSADGPDSIPRLSTHPWQRTVYPPCTQVEFLTLDYSIMPDSPNRADVFEQAKNLGPEQSEASCYQYSSYQKTLTVLADKKFDATKSSLMSLPGLRGYARKPRSLPAGALTDDEKVEMLERDKAALGPRLDATPHIKALLAAELERLSSTADLLRRWRAGTLVVVRATVPYP